jgi:putative chitinase
MRFDHKAFFTGYREHFGGSDGVSQQEVTGLSRLLAGIEHDPHVKRIDDAAYMLATSKWETAHTFHPIHEYGSRNYFIKRYGGQTRKGKELGNDTPEEGYYYAGKSDVQLTGEDNYEKAEDALRREYPELVARWEARTGKKFDLTVGDQPNDTLDPMNVMDPELSYAIMSFGMRHGMFTGRKMSQYHGKPFSAWRPIINGTDHADDIGKIARGFEKILTDSFIDDETPAWELGELNHLSAPQTEPQTAGNGQTQELSVEMTPGGGTKIATSTSGNGDPAPKEKIVVVRPKKKPVVKRMWTKITGFVTGNALFLWLEGKFNVISGLNLPTAFWYTIVGLVMFGSLLWLFYEMFKSNQKRKMDEELIKLLVAQNSTPDNLASVIDSNLEALYRIKGYKIVTLAGSGMVSAEEDA